jgi:hypothetical protein
MTCPNTPVLVSDGLRRFDLQHPHERRLVLIIEQQKRRGRGWRGLGYVPISGQARDRGGNWMSVIVTLRAPGDPDKLEQVAAEQKDVIRGITERAQGLGLIAHRFYGSEGQIMVVDEWPAPETFQRFWEQESQAIGPIMAQVTTGEPEVTFWRKLETHDEVGWD